MELRRKPDKRRLTTKLTKHSKSSKLTKETGVAMLQWDAGAQSRLSLASSVFSESSAALVFPLR
jgi:hypothetical protein